MGNYPHPLPPRLPPSANRKNNLFYPTPPSPWEVFSRNPLLYVAQWLYKHQPPLSPPLTKSSRSIKIVCISDTHNEEPKIPDGDVLVHAGDLTNLGFFAEIQAQLDWLNSLPHEHKIVIAGNHDRLLDNDYGTRHPNLKWREPDTDPRGKHDLNWGNIIYLEKTSASLSIRGQTINVYGSPMTPQYGNSGFQYLRHDNIWAKAVPSSSDIVVTHGPARGHLDLEGHGCVHLNRELWRTKPRLHVCGHLHAGRGVQYVDWGWFQALYDTICRDRKGFWRTIGMMVLWVWMWIRFVVLGRRASRTVFANVAIQGERGMNEATVVDL